MLTTDATTRNFDAADQPRGETGSRPRTVLICHHDAPLDHDGMARWLASFSDLAGLVIIEETRAQVQARVKRELKRVGPLRFLDVLAFRAYYRSFLQPADTRWTNAELERLRGRFAAASCPILRTRTPNGEDVVRFIRAARPDIVIARSKFLLKAQVFSIPRHGTYVMHPGICPEYRNAHGCFWALAERDLDRVGLTLLKIDNGIDTGPVYGYYSYPWDERRETHYRIQSRIVLDNLDRLAATLLDIHRGRADPIETTGRRSGTWGQPWLTKYFGWKLRARTRRIRRAAQ